MNKEEFKKTILNELKLQLEKNKIDYVKIHCLNVLLVEYCDNYNEFNECMKSLGIELNLKNIVCREKIEKFINDNNN